MFECPNCGGNLKFHIPSQQLMCNHCQMTMNPYAFDNKETDAIEQTSFDATIFTCPQCGGEILSTDTSVAEFCSFCGASTILYSRIRKEKRPTYIIPFQKTKEDCKKAYGSFMKKAIFAPDSFKDPKQIDSFRGIYMPYWTFDLTQNQPFSLKGTRTHRHGDYIYTDHYALNGELDASYRGLSYDASSSFDDAISKAIAPYNIKEMKPFTPAYLSGFYGDTADVEADMYLPEAKAIAQDTSMQEILHTPAFFDYTLTGGADISFHTEVSNISYAMFPVWFLSYRNKDRVAYAVVNGQTGKVVSDLPIDFKKYLIGSFLLAIPIFIFLQFSFTITPRTLVGITTIIALLAIVFLLTEAFQIRKKEPTCKKKPLGFLTSFLAIFLGIGLFYQNPANDLWFYGTAILSLAGIFVTIKDIIYHYNILATRRLPQFDRTGGDDHA